MRVSYSPPVIRQIAEAFDYIVQENPAAANDFLLRVESMASLLSGRPGIGRTTSKPGVQVIGLPPYPYLMFYKVLGDELRVIRVRHMRRRDATSTRGL
jgi:toxin ParE1/3/4